MRFFQLLSSRRIPWLAHPRGRNSRSALRRTCAALACEIESLETRCLLAGTTYFLEPAGENDAPPGTQEPPFKIISLSGPLSSLADNVEVLPEIKPQDILHFQKGYYKILFVVKPGRGNSFNNLDVIASLRYQDGFPSRQEDRTIGNLSIKAFPLGPSHPTSLVVPGEILVEATFEVLRETEVTIVNWVLVPTRGLQPLPKANLPVSPKANLPVSPSTPEIGILLEPLTSVPISSPTLSGGEPGSTGLSRPLEVQTPGTLRLSPRDATDVSKSEDVPIPRSLGSSLNVPTLAKPLEDFPLRLSVEEPSPRELFGPYEAGALPGGTLEILFSDPEVLGNLLPD